MDTNCSQTLSKKKEQERILSNSLYEVRIITLIPEKKKLQTYLYTPYDYRPKKKKISVTKY